MANHFPIKSVARRTGLSAHVIRIWEKRYNAVTPARTPTNRRLYSEEHIQRLNLLREVTQSGHNISLMARLPTPELEAIAAGAEGRVPNRSGAPRGEQLSNCLWKSVEAVRNLDSGALEATLNEAETALGAQGLLQRVIAPLAATIGELWRDGSITAAHEHFASAVLRLFLSHSANQFAGSEHSPVVVVSTPSGQLHELGALLVASSAANLGWRVTYLGASLPAAEIAGAARQQGARCVALSLVYPGDDPRLGGELSRLRALLPPEVVVLVGGRAMPSYQDALKKIGAVQVKDLIGLCSALDEIRRSSTKDK
jgi:methanogenic corrinoid protein MtbC1